MTPEQIEYIGYVASFFVAISFLFKDIKTIRIINLIGCTIFVVYGYLIDSKPIMITNIFIVMVQLYFLIFQKDKLTTTEN